MTRQIRTPLFDNTASNLKAGERVEISGIIYTARDQAHKRLIETIEKGELLPFDLKGQIIFYAGPAPTPPERIVGSIGPTTSGRMDEFTPVLLELGLKGMIGKGPRSPEVKAAIKKHKAVYLAATGGAAAFLSSFVKKAELLAYPELGPEAIYRLRVERFPAVVAVDSRGVDLFQENRKNYRRA